MPARARCELYETYKKIGLALRDFEGPRFKRIAHIRKLIEDGLLDSSLRWTNQEPPPPSQGPPA